MSYPLPIITLTEHTLTKFHSQFLFPSLRLQELLVFFLVSSEGSIGLRKLHQQSLQVFIPYEINPFKNKSRLYYTLKRLVDRGWILKKGPKYYTLPINSIFLVSLDSNSKSNYWIFSETVSNRSISISNFFSVFTITFLRRPKNDS